MLIACKSEEPNSVMTNPTKNLAQNSLKDNITKVLGVWLGNQFHNFKNKINIMKYNNICDIWEEFITSDTYSKYFK